MKRTGKKKAAKQVSTVKPAATPVQKPAPAMYCPDKEDGSENHRRQGTPHADLGRQTAAVSRHRLSGPARGDLRSSYLA